MRKFHKYSNSDKVFRVTLLGFFINIFLTLLKYFAGIFGRSSAMIADATHSLSDLISDIVVLFFVKIAAQPDDEKHRYGHGKFETFSTFIVGTILAFAGIGILWDAGHKIYQHFFAEKIPPPETFALYAAFISIVLKEALFWITLRVGKKTNSQVAIANAWHHRTDSLSSVATLAGIAGAIFLGGEWRILDPIAAAIVSFFILRVAYKIAMPAINDLLEQSLPLEVRQKIILLCKEIPHVQNPHSLRTRRLGNNYAIELHININKDMTVEESHKVTLAVEHAIREEFGSHTHVVIHVEPAD